VVPEFTKPIPFTEINVLPSAAMSFGSASITNGSKKPYVLLSFV